MNKTDETVARLFGAKEYSVEVSWSHSEDFPFKEFRKKPYEHSGRYLGGDEGRSWANFGFTRLANAKRFAVRAKEKGFEARIFKLKVIVDFEYNLITRP